MYVYCLIYNTVGLSWAGHDNGDDESEQTDGLSEDKNEDHSHEEFGLDCVHAHAHVTNYTNSEAWTL